jgi:hypothetical protein
VSDPVVPVEKVRDYLLNIDHVDGAPKAKFFIGGGFSPEKPDELARALRHHFLDNQPTTKTTDRFGGVRITIDAPMPVPDGRAPIVRSVWTIDEGETVPRLITAYPLD